MKESSILKDPMQEEMNNAALKIQKHYKKKKKEKKIEPLNEM